MDKVLEQLTQMHKEWMNIHATLTDPPSDYKKDLTGAISGLRTAIVYLEHAVKEDKAEYAKLRGEISDFAERLYVDHPDIANGLFYILGD